VQFGVRTQYLANMRVEWDKGLFPHTAEAVKDKVFGFVHLDVDLYESTLAGLKFFYPHLFPGGF
jgi:O-methyltransferase